jgi:riboflavin synthase
MFTGIVASVGRVLSLERRAIAHPGAPESLELRVASGFDDLTLGESVAVNGVCLTVTKFSREGDASFDVSPETLDKTNLGALTPEARVNLERALLPTERLSGHLVQGHVDAVGRWLGAETVGEYWKARVAVPKALARYCITKGSIALDGTSLTINRLEDPQPGTPFGCIVEIMLIPHTWNHTRLSDLREGDGVNVEVDLIAKYTERLLQCRT